LDITPLFNTAVVEDHCSNTCDIGVMEDMCDDLKSIRNLDSDQSLSIRTLAGNITDQINQQMEE
jgi:hypothetical protein